MTTLENRPNTALLVVDVQNGVVEGAHERDAVVANVGSLVEKARRERVPVVWVQHSDEQPREGERRVADRPRADPGRRRAARREELRRLLRGHHPRDRAVGPRRRATRRRRRADRCVHPLDAPRRVRQGVRRDPRQRRPHDGGPDGSGARRRRTRSSRTRTCTGPTRRRRGGRPGRSRPRTSTSAARPEACPGRSSRLPPTSAARAADSRQARPRSRCASRPGGGSGG